MRRIQHVNVYVPEQNASFLNSSGSTLRRTATISRDKSPSKFSVSSKEDAALYHDSFEKGGQKPRAALADGASKGSGRDAHETSDGNSSSHMLKFRSVPKTFSKEFHAYPPDLIEPLLKQMDKDLKSRLGNALLQVIKNKVANFEHMIKNDEFVTDHDGIEIHAELSHNATNPLVVRRKSRLGSGNPSISYDAEDGVLHQSHGSYESHQINSDSYSDQKTNQKVRFSARFHRDSEGIPNLYEHNEYNLEEEIGQKSARNHRKGDPLSQQKRASHGTLDINVMNCDKSAADEEELQKDVGEVGHSRSEINSTKKGGKFQPRKRILQNSNKSKSPSPPIHPNQIMDGHSMTKRVLRLKTMDNRDELFIQDAASPGDNEQKTISLNQSRYLQKLVSPSKPEDFDLNEHKARIFNLSTILVGMLRRRIRGAFVSCFISAIQLQNPVRERLDQLLLQSPKQLLNTPVLPPPRDDTPGGISSPPQLLLSSAAEANQQQIQHEVTGTSPSTMGSRPRLQSMQDIEYKSIIQMGRVIIRAKENLILMLGKGLYILARNCEHERNKEAEREMRKMIVGGILTRVAGRLTGEGIRRWRRVCAGIREVEREKDKREESMVRIGGKLQRIVGQKKREQMAYSFLMMRAIGYIRKIWASERIRSLGLCAITSKASMERVSPLILSVKEAAARMERRKQKKAQTIDKLTSNWILRLSDGFKQLRYITGWQGILKIEHLKSQRLFCNLLIKIFNIKSRELLLEVWSSLQEPSKIHSIKENALKQKSLYSTIGLLRMHLLVSRNKSGNFVAFKSALISNLLINKENSIRNLKLRNLVSNISWSTKTKLLESFSRIALSSHINDTLEINRKHVLRKLRSKLFQKMLHALRILTRVSELMVVSQKLIYTRYEMLATCLSNLQNRKRQRQLSHSLSHLHLGWQQRRHRERMLQRLLIQQSRKRQGEALCRLLEHRLRQELAMQEWESARRKQAAEDQASLVRSLEEWHKDSQRTLQWLRLEVETNSKARDLMRLAFVVNRVVTDRVRHAFYSGCCFPAREKDYQLRIRRSMATNRSTLSGLLILQTLLLPRIRFGFSALFYLAQLEGLKNVRNQAEEIWQAKGSENFTSKRISRMKIWRAIDWLIRCQKLKLIHAFFRISCWAREKRSTRQIFQLSAQRGCDIISRFETRKTEYQLRSLIFKWRETTKIIALQESGRNKVLRRLVCCQASKVVYSFAHLWQSARIYVASILLLVTHNLINKCTIKDYYLAFSKMSKIWTSWQHNGKLTSIKLNYAVFGKCRVAFSKLKGEQVLKRSDRIKQHSIQGIGLLGRLIRYQLLDNMQSAFYHLRDWSVNSNLKSHRILIAFSNLQRIFRYKQLRTYDSLKAGLNKQTTDSETQTQKHSKDAAELVRILAFNVFDLEGISREMSTQTEGILLRNRGSPQTVLFSTKFHVQKQLPKLEVGIVDGLNVLGKPLSIIDSVIVSTLEINPNPPITIDIQTSTVSETSLDQTNLPTIEISDQVKLQVTKFEEFSLLPTSRSAHLSATQSEAELKLIKLGLQQILRMFSKVPSDLDNLSSSFSSLKSRYLSHRLQSLYSSLQILKESSERTVIELSQLHPISAEQLSREPSSAKLHSPNTLLTHAHRRSVSNQWVQTLPLYTKILRMLKLFDALRIAKQREICIIVLRGQW